MTRHPVVVQQLWRRDVTSPFPHSGNGGYICNQDVPFQSIMPDELGSLTKCRYCCPFQHPRKPPDPPTATGAEDRTGLTWRESITVVPLDPYSKTYWIKLGKHSHSRDAAETKSCS